MWIEIIDIWLNNHSADVTPFAGVWIEIGVWLMQS